MGFVEAERLEAAVTLQAAWRESRRGKSRKQRVRLMAPYRTDAPGNDGDKDSGGWAEMKGRFLSAVTSSVFSSAVQNRLQTKSDW